MPKSVLIHKYSLSPNYVFSVGTLQPRKNFVRLIEAFSTILQRNQPEFIDLQLVIVGKKGWLYDEILAAPERYSIETRVKFLNFVHDDDLKYLYKYALTFVLPSLYEGFGLPVAEAMSQGCPVVVSQTSSLPEIAGKAGVYIDPEDVGSIAKGLLIALGERTQKQGKYRINQGLERVKEFNWDSAAKQVLDIFQDVGPKNI